MIRTRHDVVEAYTVIVAYNKERTVGSSGSHTYRYVTLYVSK